MKERKNEKIARDATNMVLDFFVDLGLLSKDEIETITTTELISRMNKMADEAGFKSPKERGRYWAGLFDKRNRNNKTQ